MIEIYALFMTCFAAGMAACTWSLIGQRSELLDLLHHLRPVYRAATTRPAMQPSNRAAARKMRSRR